jgi:hypothetical protein
MLTPEELHRAWFKQAQLDAERGVIECRMCRDKRGLDETITLWRNGVLVFAVCDRCAASHDLLMRPTDKGIDIRARPRAPIFVRGANG